LDALAGGAAGWADWVPAVAAIADAGRTSPAARKFRRDESFGIRVLAPVIRLSQTTLAPTTALGEALARSRTAALAGKSQVR
jgi:hypothetical protein